MEPEKKEKQDKEAAFELYDWLQCIVIAIVVGILCFIFVARVITVEGDSMYPTLHNTDLIITSDLFYEPKNGDVIVFQTDSYGPSPLVKRVIATEGQTVDIDFDKGIVYVDGVALEEEYTNSPTTVHENFEGEVTVPKGCVFVLGDNRNASEDSRSDRIGFVDKRCIIGKVLVIAIPGADESDPREWGRIGSPYNE